MKDCWTHQNRALLCLGLSLLVCLGFLFTVQAQVQTEDRGSSGYCGCDSPPIYHGHNFDCHAYCCGQGGKWARSAMCGGETRTESEFGSVIADVLIGAFTNKNVPRWNVRTADAFQALNCAAFLSQKAAAVAERGDVESLYTAQYLSERAEMAMEGAALDFECPRVSSASFSDETAFRVKFAQHLVKLRVDLAQAEHDLKEKEEVERKAQLDLERAELRTKAAEGSALEEAMKALREAKAAHEAATKALEAARREHERIENRFQTTQTCVKEAQDLSECWK